MSKILLALTSAAVLSLAGCSGLYVNQPGGKPAASAGAISPEAAAALKAAQADVKTAKEKNALWTTAKDALEAAEEAAAKGDSETVLKKSKLASDHVKKGLEQLNYPVLKVGD